MFKTIILWICRLVAAIIMLQTLYFKFSAAPESMYIFHKLGLEPYGRIGTGVLELVASALIINPKTTLYGAILALGLMAGAVASHLGPLGIEIMGDGGTLFTLAIIVLICSVLIIILQRQQLKDLLNSIKNAF